MPHDKRWIISPPLPDSARAELKAFPPILQQLLYNRGYATDSAARAYLRAQVDFDTNPLQLLDMETAITRIRHALTNGEAIAIYGDYDVDGVTATALLVQTLRALGGNVRGYIPNRFDEGYGLNTDALDTLKNEGIRLVISVDCGIRSLAEAQHARRIGLDLIISDHHHPDDNDLPEALAVINPKRAGDPYPDKNLAGVGVAYKIAQALEPPAELFENLLDLVALGTVADLAPLIGENRALVRKGLHKIRTSQRQGLFALAQIAGLILPKTTATDIGFILGPRLNAAGRLESALAAFDLLMTEDIFVAGQLAQKLDLQNQERQKITRAIQQQAEQIALQEDPSAYLLFAVHPQFNSGVVGLAASRLVETFYRPAIVGQIGEETTRCSCRSIAEFHITNALDECKDLLIRHGGHAAAAGFTVHNRNLPALKERLQQIARRELEKLDLRQALTADMEVPLHQMTGDVLKFLEYLQPTGYGNRHALFVSRHVTVKRARTVGQDAQHLSLELTTDGRVIFDAIGFRFGNRLATISPGAKVDVIYALEKNEFNNREKLQLLLKDIKPAGTPDS
ncbi:MAG: single-stranded-DNA-specific exonuclease RecJ [Anaerolineales bacterium]|nr:single-stranded-DNA-specific exonuclease RecJ [Anaerolineales bacterium]MCX7754144.1 single-stranded-DNA-specific exonuclease RecJ [Anaerolineales bacterium]MDW8278058.1 single-stranded-DNA-specific exonuclease RecJ [Anaerolineales bacterium]